MISLLGWKVKFHNKKYDCIAIKFVNDYEDAIDSMVFPTYIGIGKCVVLAINRDGIMETLESNYITDFEFFK